MCFESPNLQGMGAGQKGKELEASEQGRGSGSCWPPWLSFPLPGYIDGSFLGARRQMHVRQSHELEELELELLHSRGANTT